MVTLEAARMLSEGELIFLDVPVGARKILLEALKSLPPTSPSYSRGAVKTENDAHRR